ncbi:MAG: hypothetical protein FWF22_10190 [Treponema sp.]|nr:hypothetical protein [Treponema sp.]
MASILTTPAAIVAVIAILIVLPSIIITSARKNSMHKRQTELEKLKYQKEMLELELQKQQNEIKLLQEESKKYDRIINGDS